MLFHSLIRLFALAGASFLLVPTAPAWAVNAQVGILKCDTSTGIGEIHYAQTDNDLRIHQE